MACNKPNYFIDLGKKPNGKRFLKMLPQRVDTNLRALQDRYGDKNILVVPCGKCDSCLKAYRRQWSLRCEAEARCHLNNCYLTLTLEDKNLHEINKQDLKDFFKALRNRNIKVRYFACGEHGDKFNRPHYHAILFGYMPSDLKFYKKSKTGFNMYTSKFLESIWKKGFVTVQEFSPETAGYVAGYVNKKIDRDDSFIVMSTKPGIGAFYYRKNMESLMKNDNFVSHGGFVASLPRYFDKVADSMFYDLEDIKDTRIEKAMKISLSTAQDHGFTNLEEVYKYQGDKERRKQKGYVRDF